MAYIATLEGYISPTWGYNYTGRRYRGRSGELSGLWSAAKGLAKSAVRVAVAPITGTAHTIMEAKRGIERGDIKRVLTAPIKGIGHGVGETVRGTKQHMEWYWRPSKMSQWMQPVGGAMTTVAPFTGPAAPFLLAGGAGLTVAGSIAGKVHGTHLQRQAVRAAARGETSQAQTYATQAAAKKKQTNTWLIVGGVAAAGAALLMLT